MKVWVFFCAVVLHAYEYNLVVSSVFKDEAPYFKEWIEYHKMMGVEHFRLYNNDSSDDYLSVLEPYIKKGEVTVIDWPSSEEMLDDWVSYTQWPACQDAIEEFKGRSKWLAFIDIDEFMMPLEAPDMLLFLQEYEAYPGVTLNWQCFGTSYVKEIPKNQLMIESLTLKAEEMSERNRPVKSIIRPECVDLENKAWAPHTYHYLEGMLSVFPDKRVRAEGVGDIKPLKAIINHYVHRSEDYFWKTKIAKKQRMEKGGCGNNLEYIERWYRDCNQVEDKRIFRFVPALRKRVFPQIKLDEVCKRYNRPFTLLSLGEENISELANAYPESVFIVFGGKVQGDNVIVFNHQVSSDELRMLASCEHVDIALLPKERFEDLEVLKKMSHIVVCGEVIEGTKPFRLEQTTLIHPKKLRRAYDVFCDYDHKLLRKTRPDLVEEIAWEPGINLMTYVLFNGVFPSRQEIITNIPVDHCHRDLVPNNMILQGKKVILIDGDDPTSAKVRADGGARFRNFKRAVDQVLLETEGLNFKEARQKILSIYGWEKYFEQTEIDE